MLKKKEYLKVLLLSLAIASLITIFESIKHFTLPGITIWQSHFITILFATTVGTLIGYFTLKKIKSLYALMLKEIERRKDLQIKFVRLSEREKNSLGEILHDGLGQELTGISFLLESLAQQMKSSSLTNLVTRINTLVNQAIDHTRATSHVLYPVALRDHGLILGLEELGLNMQKMSGSKCQIINEGFSSNSLDHDQSRQLYLLAQEAILNSIKHGQATKITINLLENAEEIIFKIQDNGKGFNLGDLDNRPGIGMSIMQSRADLIGGTLEVFSQPNQGTTILCRINNKEHK